MENVKISMTPTSSSDGTKQNEPMWSAKESPRARYLVYSRPYLGEISIDFITDLPPSGPDLATNCMVIADRLSKGVILEAMADISAEAVADRFLRCFYAYSGLPRAIVSDRGPQFVG